MISGSGPTDAHAAAPSPYWLLLLAVAVVELIALPVRMSRVARVDDWKAAAAFVREQQREGDAFEVAPSWADPWLRWALGDRMSLSDAAHADRAAYSRLWTLSLRGRDVANTPATDPDIDRVFGKVRVRRWPLNKTQRYDFVANVRHAHVSRVVRDDVEACPWKSMPVMRGGGLGVGALFPTERFQCDARKPWLFVAPVVLEGLDLTPRYCLWQHPQGRDPIVARFSQVPLADQLVFEGGLYYEHERDQTRGPVHVKVRFDDRDVERMIHSDGDGWKRVVIDTRARHGQRVDVSVEVSADAPHFRSFCWTASTRIVAAVDAARAEHAAP